jgi:hypothetical protein
MQHLKHSYSTVWNEIRGVIELHKEWVEKGLGVVMSDTVIVETDIMFHNAAVQHLTGYQDPRAAIALPIARLIPQIQAVEIPPSYVPVLEVATCRANDDSIACGDDQNQERWTDRLEWVDGPVLFKLRAMNSPFVALCAPYHLGPYSSGANKVMTIVLSRQAIPEYMEMVKQLKRDDGMPKLIIDGEDPLDVDRCAWDDLVLDESIVSLLKGDFECFFERRAWFRKMRLPFRRGYLLHGPPGNGKSSAIRAMMTSCGLTAYTIRLFDSNVEDKHLEYAFNVAAKYSPAIILLEDIDRSFPRTGETRSKISLQSLLNCLDGVASGEGIVTIATANEPTALDPAILRRPGRFDRVVSFPNPTPELRRQYFLQMQPSFADLNLDQAVDESNGFSFALLSEAYIMAAQAGFATDQEMGIDDLLNSIWSLRNTLLFGSLKASAGFTHAKASRTFRPDAERLA